MNHELAAAVAVCLAVVARCGGFIAASTFPVYPGIDVRVRLVMAIAVSAVAMPGVLASGIASDAITPLAVVAEAMLGLAMGTAVACVTAAAAWALGMAAAACGLAAGDDADPLSGEGAGIARLAWWISAGGFVAAGGARGVLSGLLDSFVAMPLGGRGDGVVPQLLAVATTLPASAFTIAVSLALPLLAAIVAYHVVVAIATRAAGFESGLGLVQASAAILLVAILFLTADVWIVGFPRRIDDAVAGAFTAKEVR
jgi:flagellar biosynthetic protein FliR